MTEKQKEVAQVLAAKKSMQFNKSVAAPDHFAATVRFRAVCRWHGVWENEMHLQRIKSVKRTNQRWGHA
jgi:hypothetical protein